MKFNELFVAYPGTKVKSGIECSKATIPASCVQRWIEVWKYQAEANLQILGDSS